MSSPFISRLFIQLLKDGYQIRSRAKGGSMFPLIQIGDLLTVKPASFSQMHIGDVAVYGSGDPHEDTLTAHRVVKKRASKRPFLGTHCDFDGWSGDYARVVPEQLYGKVVQIERGTEIINLNTLRFRVTSNLRIRLSQGSALVKRALRNPFRLPSVLFRRIVGRGRSAGLNQPCAKLRFNPDTGGKPRYQKRENFVYAQTDEGTFLVPIRNRTADMENILMLNPTASHIWELMTQGKKSEEIQNAIVQGFGLEPQQAQGDIEKFLAAISDFALTTKNHTPILLI